MPIIHALFVYCVAFHESGVHSLPPSTKGDPDVHFPLYLLFTETATIFIYHILCFDSYFIVILVKVLCFHRKFEPHVHTKNIN